MRTVSMPEPPEYSRREYAKMGDKLISSFSEGPPFQVNYSARLAEPFTDIVFRADLANTLNEATCEYVEQLESSGDKTYAALAVLERNELKKRPFGKYSTFNPCGLLQEILWWYTSNQEKFGFRPEIPQVSRILDRHFRDLEPMSWFQVVDRVDKTGSAGGLVGGHIKKIVAQVSRGIVPSALPYGISAIQPRFQYGGKIRALNNIIMPNAYQESAIAIPLNDAVMHEGLSYNGPINAAYLNVRDKFYSVNAKYGVKLDAYKFGPTVPTLAYLDACQWISNRFGDLGNMAILPFINTYVYLQMGALMACLRVPVSGSATGQPLNNPLGTLIGLYPSFVMKHDEGWNIEFVGNVDDQLIMTAHNSPMEAANRYSTIAERYGVISDPDEAEITEGCVILGKKVWRMSEQEIMPITARFVGRLMVQENDSKHTYWNTPLHVFDKFNEWAPVQFKMMLGVFRTLFKDVFNINEPDLGIGCSKEQKLVILTFVKDLIKRKASEYLQWKGRTSLTEYHDVLRALINIDVTK